MSEPVRIEVPGVPVGKGRPRFSRKSGHAYTPEKTASYEAVVKFFAAQEMAGRTPLTGPLAVQVHAYMPIPASWSKKKQQQARAMALMPITKPDLSNIAKAAEDPLNNVVWGDDSQIVRLSMSKAYSDEPRLVIMVEPLA